MGAATLAVVNNADRNHAGQPRWRPLLEAMSKAGGAALASGLLSALAVKMIAVFAGPAQVALYSTLQQVRQAGLVAATGNGQTAVIRSASALHARERREYLRTSALIFAMATCATALILLLAPLGTARLLGLPDRAQRAVPWLSIPVVCSSLFVFLSALLNGLGRIGDLAALQGVTGIALAAGAWLAARGALAGYPEALSLLLGFSAGVSAVGVLFVMFRQRSAWADWFHGPGALWSPRAAREFFAMSAGMFLSGLVASAVLLVVRGRIMYAQGPIVTGQFDAAWGISMNHVMLVLASLQTYYLPALARSADRARRNTHITNALTVTALAAAVLIAGVSWLRPQMIAWFYSGSFRPASAYLRWTLIGDYLKVTSWILSVPILAAGKMRVFLAADLAAYGAFAGSALALSHWFAPAVSAAMAFVVMYAVHLLICACYLFRCQQVKLAREAWMAWSSGLALVAAASALFWNRL